MLKNVSNRGDWTRHPTYQWVTCDLLKLSRGKKDHNESQTLLRRCKGHKDTHSSNICSCFPYHSAISAAAIKNDKKHGRLCEYVYYHSWNICLSLPVAWAEKIKLPSWNISQNILFPRKCAKGLEINWFVFLFNFHFMSCVFNLQVCLCYMCMPNAFRNHKRALGSPGLKLKWLWANLEVGWIKHGVLWERSQCSQPPSLLLSSKWTCFLSVQCYSLSYFPLWLSSRSQAWHL